MRGTVIALLAIVALWTSGAGAQRHERFRSDHWVYDDRFHHNHYYPVLGYSVTVLPPGAFAVTFRGGRYWYHSGVWFVPSGPGYVVARPPVGILVPALPPGATVVYVGGIPYYYANDVYYIAQPAGGYAVAAPPATPTTAPAAAGPPTAGPSVPPAQTPPPQTPPQHAAPPAGTWYYCDSSKAYYPYVNECQEGWKPVPATPPGVR
jgi:uncharacterized protein DUF6515